MLLGEHVYCVAVAFEMTEQVEQRICIKFCIKIFLHGKFLHGNYSDDSKSCSYGQLVIGSFITTMCPFMHHSFAELFDETSNHPGDPAPLQPRFSTLQLLGFPKTTITLEKEEISTEIFLNLC